MVVVKCIFVLHRCAKAYFSCQLFHRNKQRIHRFPKVVVFIDILWKEQACAIPCHKLNHSSFCLVHNLRSFRLTTLLCYPSVLFGFSLHSTKYTLSLRDAVYRLDTWPTGPVVLVMSGESRLLVFSTRESRRRRAGCSAALSASPLQPSIMIHRS